MNTGSISLRRLLHDSDGTLLLAVGLVYMHGRVLFLKTGNCLYETALSKTALSCYLHVGKEMDLNILFLFCFVFLHDSVHGPDRGAVNGWPCVCVNKSITDCFLQQEARPPKAMTCSALSLQLSPLHSVLSIFDRRCWTCTAS